MKSLFENKDRSETNNQRFRSTGGRLGQVFFLNLGMVVLEKFTSTAGVGAVVAAAAAGDTAPTVGSGDPGGAGTRVAAARASGAPPSGSGGPCRCGTGDGYGGDLRWCPHPLSGGLSWTRTPFHRCSCSRASLSWVCKVFRKKTARPHRMLDLGTFRLSAPPLPLACLVGLGIHSAPGPALLHPTASLPSL